MTDLIRVLLSEDEDGVNIMGRDEDSGEVYAERGNSISSFVAQIAKKRPLDARIEFRWRPGGPVVFERPETLRGWLTIAASRGNEAARAILEAPAETGAFS